MQRHRLVLITLALGCAENTDDVCRQAARHFAECSGAEVAADSGTCDAQAAQLAEQVLATSCDEIGSEEARADALSSGTGVLACTLPVIPLFVTGLNVGDPCCFGYNCAGDDITCRDFTCTPKSALGGPCAHRSHCADGLVCIDESCTTAREVGERCDGPDVCALGLTCNDLGRCVEPRALGQSCDQGSPCTAFYECRSGTCQEPSTVGAACESFTACGSSETCWQGVCEPRHERNGPCVDLLDCTLGLFCHDGSCQPH